MIKAFYEPCPTISVWNENEHPQFWRRLLLMQQLSEFFNDKKEGRL
jgi:hypothetical protein